MVQQKAEDKHIPEQLAEVKAAINSRTNFIRPVSEQEKGFCEGYYRHSGRDRVNPTFTRSEKIFFTTDACIGCSVCQSVCPHESWSVVDGKGKPEGDCETCFACVHNCPSKAISIIPTPPEPEEPNRNARYRNPNVKLGDIIQANSQRKF
jgi:formate hydrogenlyase subunit 6/NADH:ubiquinone oxidoreductase subunit I